MKGYVFLFAEFAFSIYSDPNEVTEDTLNTKEEALVTFLKAEKPGKAYGIFTMAPRDIEASITTLAQGGNKAAAAMFSDKILSRI